MKIARAQLTRVRLRLRAPIVTGRGPIDTREGSVIELMTDSGVAGFGEALPLAGFSDETPDRVSQTIAGLVRVLLGREVEDREALLDLVDALAPKAPMARAAVDGALFDLAARASDTSVAALLAESAQPRAQIEVNALLTAESPEAVARQAAVAVAEDYRTLKLKVGARAIEIDEARVVAVREAAGREARIRLDANGSWTESEAERAIARFASQRIELLEQPVEARDLAALARLSADSPIPIAADEALAGGHAVEEIFARAAASVLVLKPAALGGLRASQRLAARARAAGWGVVVTSTLDSAVGRAAAIQLAAALPGPHLAAGLATGGLLEWDLGSAPAPSRGAIALPGTPGSGFGLRREALIRSALGRPREIYA